MISARAASGGSIDKVEVQPVGIVWPACKAATVVADLFDHFFFGGGDGPAGAIIAGIDFFQERVGVGDVGVVCDRGFEHAARVVDFLSSR